MRYRTIKRSSIIVIFKIIESQKVQLWSAITYQKGKAFIDTLKHYNPEGIQQN